VFDSKLNLSWPLIAASVATCIFIVLTASAEFTLMADDYDYLGGAYDPDTFYRDHLGRSMSRVPIWTLVAWGIFGSRVIETSWVPMYAFFFLHALGISLIAAWLGFQLL